MEQLSRFAIQMFSHIVCVWDVVRFTSHQYIAVVVLDLHEFLLAEPCTAMRLS